MWSVSALSAAACYSVWSWLIKSMRNANKERVPKKLGSVAEWNDEACIVVNVFKGDD